MQKFSNLAQTTLASAATETDTTISVTDGGVFPTLGTGDWCMAVLYAENTEGETQHEIVRVTAVSGNDLTVERAQEGFAAQAYNAGDYISVRNTAGSMEALWSATQADTVATTTESINRADGGIQTLTLTADATLSVTMDEGHSLTLHLSGGDAHTVTWPTMTWVGGSAPTLTAADVIEFWKVGTTLYGAYVGSIA